MSREVKNEGLAVVAHIVHMGTHARAFLMDYNAKQFHEDNGGSFIGPVCRHSEALAGYAVRDARIAELEEDNKHLTDENGLCAKRILELDAQPMLAGTLLNLVTDEATRLRAELVAIKAQEPVAAQQRFRHPQKGTPDWSIWQPTPVNNGRAKWCIDGAGYEVEYQPLYAAPVAKQVVIPEPRFYWADSEEGSFGSPEEWAQDYYDYNGEKPESVLLSCAASLPDREYDSFEFDGSGNCISCRLVGEDSARLNAADHAEGDV